MTNIEDIVQRALLSALQRHSIAMYGTTVDIPGTIPPIGTPSPANYSKMTGWFALADVARDIANAIERDGYVKS
jgi:hypothetical protein